MIAEMEMAVFGKWPKSSISYIEEGLDAGRRGATPQPETSSSDPISGQHQEDFGRLVVCRIVRI